MFRFVIPIFVTLVLFSSCGGKNIAYVKVRNNLDRNLRAQIFYDGIDQSSTDAKTIRIGSSEIFGLAWDSSDSFENLDSAAYKCTITGLDSSGNAIPGLTENVESYMSNGKEIDSRVSTGYEDDIQIYPVGVGEKDFSFFSVSVDSDDFDVTLF